MNEHLDNYDFSKSRNVIRTDVLYGTQQILKTSVMVELSGKIEELKSATHFAHYYVNKKVTEELENDHYAKEGGYTIHSVPESLVVVVMLEEILHPFCLSLLDDASYIANADTFGELERLDCWDKRFPYYEEIFEMSKKLDDLVAIEGPINDWGSEVCLWINECRVRSRSLERLMVEVYTCINGAPTYYNKVSAISVGQPYHEDQGADDCWLYLTSVVNELSSVFFKMGICLNKVYGGEDG